MKPAGLLDSFLASQIFRIVQPREATDQLALPENWVPVLGPKVQVYSFCSHACGLSQHALGQKGSDAVWI